MSECKRRKLSAHGRREFGQKRRSVIWRVLLLTVVTVLAYLAMLMYIRTLANHEMESDFNTRSSTVANRLSGYADSSCSDEEIRDIVQRITLEYSRTYFDMRIYRLDAGDAEIVTDEGVMHTSVVATSVWEDERSAQEIYADEKQMQLSVMEDADDAESLYENTRSYMQQVDGRVGADMDYSESVFSRLHGSYFYRSTTVILANERYFLVTAMYRNPFEWISTNRADVKNVLMVGTVSVCVLLLFYVIAAAFSYRRSKMLIMCEDERREIMTAIAHDVRGPLTAISGYAENLRQLIDGETEQHYIDSILHNTIYMNDMVTNMLSYMKLEARPEIKPEKVNLSEVLDELRNRYQDLLLCSGKEIHIDGQCSVTADIRLMKLMFDNLITNAIAYSPDSSVIDVKMDDGSIIVKNSMSQAPGCDADELWQPLTKGSSARTGRSGSGLGLSIVKNILDMSGFTGEIDVLGGEFVVVIHV